MAFSFFPLISAAFSMKISLSARHWSPDRRQHPLKNSGMKCGKVATPGFLTGNEKGPVNPVMPPGPEAIRF